MPIRFDQLVDNTTTPAQRWQNMSMPTDKDVSNIIQLASDTGTNVYDAGVRYDAEKYLTDIAPDEHPLSIGEKIATLSSRAGAGVWNSFANYLKSDEQAKYENTVDSTLADRMVKWEEKNPPLEVTGGLDSVTEIARNKWSYHSQYKAKEKKSKEEIQQQLALAPEERTDRSFDYIGQFAPPAKQSSLAFTLAPPKNGVELAGDIVGGLGAFAIKVSLLKKVFPTINDGALWEVITQSEGQPIGSGAMMYAIFGVTGKASKAISKTIPGSTSKFVADSVKKLGGLTEAEPMIPNFGGRAAEVGLRVAVPSLTMGGVTAASGGSKEEIGIQMAIGAFFGGIEIRAGRVANIQELTQKVSEVRDIPHPVADAITKIAESKVNPNDPPSKIKTDIVVGVVEGAQRANAGQGDALVAEAKVIETAANKTTDATKSLTESNPKSIADQIVEDIRSLLEYAQTPEGLKEQERVANVIENLDKRYEAIKNAQDLDIKQLHKVAKRENIPAGLSKTEIIKRLNGIDIQERIRLTQGTKPVSDTIKDAQSIPTANKGVDSGIATEGNLADEALVAKAKQSASEQMIARVKAEQATNAPEKAVSSPVEAKSPEIPAVADALSPGMKQAGEIVGDLPKQGDIYVAHYDKETGKIYSYAGHHADTPKLEKLGLPEKEFLTKSGQGIIEGGFVNSEGKFFTDAKQALEAKQLSPPPAEKQASGINPDRLRQSMGGNVPDKIIDDAMQEAWASPEYKKLDAQRKIAVKEKANADIPVEEKPAEGQGGTGAVRQGGLQKSTEAAMTPAAKLKLEQLRKDLDERAALYGIQTRSHNVEKLMKFDKDNPELAEYIAVSADRAQVPPEFSGEEIFTTVSRRAIDTNNVELQIRLSNSEYNKVATKLARDLQSLDRGIKNDPITIMRDVQESFRDAFKKRTGNDADVVQKEGVKEMESHIAKESTLGEQKTFKDFLDGLEGEVCK